PRHVRHDECVGLGPLYGAGVDDHLVEPDLQRGLHAVDHVGDRVAHQDDVDAGAIGDHGTGVVVGGDHRDPGPSLAGANGRDRHLFICHGGRVPSGGGCASGYLERVRFKALLLVVALLVASCTSQRELTVREDALLERPSTTAAPVPTTSTTSTSTTTTTTIPPTTTTTLVPEDGLTAAERVLAPLHTIGGDISPKSVVASQTGVFVAENLR